MKSVDKETAAVARKLNIFIDALKDQAAQRTKR